MIIEISTAELAPYNLNAESWPKLSFKERRNIASAILRRRIGNADQFNARMIESNNPNFNQFAIVDRLSPAAV